MSMSGFAGGYSVPQALIPDSISANPDVLNQGSVGGALMTAILTPTFMPIMPPPGGATIFPLDSLMGKPTILEAATTMGIAIYSYTIPADNQLSASRECQLNVALDTSTQATKKGQVTAGAAGSGVNVPFVLDFARKRYLVGTMVSSVTTLQVASIAIGNTYVDVNLLKWVSAARANTTDWPASFTHADVANTGSSRFAWVNLLTAQGALQI
jgi:hypothetical protein